MSTPAKIEETFRIVRVETNEVSEVRISEPYPGDDIEWWCDLYIPALYEDRVKRAAGVDAAQARELVRRLAQDLIDHFGFQRVEDGDPPPNRTGS